MGWQTSATCRLGPLGITTVVLSLLAGCTTHAQPKVDETRVKQFAGRGYLTDHHFGIATTFSNWSVGEYSFAIAWTAPVSGNSLPVIVYLPGLGESRASGESWRTVWAQAGYAVLSVQLLEEDQRAWSSDAARRGDFGVLARERYAKEAVTARLKALATLFAELQKRHDTDEALLGRALTCRVWQLPVSMSGPTPPCLLSAKYRREMRSRFAFPFPSRRLSR